MGIFSRLLARFNHIKNRLLSIFSRIKKFIPNIEAILKKNQENQLQLQVISEHLKKNPKSTIAQQLKFCIERCDTATLKIAEKQACALWHPDLRNMLDVPHVKLRGITALSLESKTIGILGSPPWSYAELLHFVNPKSIAEYRLHSNASTDINIYENETIIKQETIPTLENLYRHIQPRDYFWIPDSTLASIFISNQALMTHIGLATKKALVLPLIVQPSTLKNDSIYPMIFPDDHMIVYNDNYVRSMLHKSGFLEIKQVLSPRNKISSYHEYQPLFINQMGEHNFPDTLNTTIEYYLANRLPSFSTEQKKGEAYV